MRTLAHLLSVALLLPSLLLACAFVIFGHTLAATSLFDFLTRLLMDFAWIVPLVCLALLLLVVLLIVLGVSERRRWIAGLLVVLLALTSALVIMVMSGLPTSPDGWNFLIPGLVSFCLGCWLASAGTQSEAIKIRQKNEYSEGDPEQVDL